MKINLYNYNNDTRVVTIVIKIIFGSLLISKSLITLNNKDPIQVY